MPTITITHQSERTKHRFTVANPDMLSEEEVNAICQEMYVESLFINGKWYDCTRRPSIAVYLEMQDKKKKKGSRKGSK
ncbi:hypothetical protein [Rurimicrobium arvi]|uniref:Uncharacterized protein n=1 Tax=Rurimicrobium arvi TaxID=2049916 RepID=A0ABP8MVY0_9BACT